MKSIAVREDRQGTGVGRMLLQRAMAACREEDRSELVVERDAFTADADYPEIEIDGIPLRDRVWLSLPLGDAAMPADS